MSAFGAASYGLAAVAFLALAVLLLTSWQGRATGARLVVATAMTAIWAGGLAWHAWYRDLPLVAVYTLELLRDGAWIVALLALAQGILPRLLVIGAHAAWAGLLIAGWALAVLQARLVIDDGPGVLFAPAGIGMALLVLVLLEQIYRNANASGRYGFKFLAIGLGGVFAYDLFLYSQAELLKSLSEDLWLSRGLVNALLVPFVAIAARRNPHWSLDVFVSRQVVVFTTTVVAVGIYLLLMAVGGYYVRQFGGTWGTTANILFIAGAIVVLAVVVMSGTLRRRLRVFVSKHFYRNKYDYRVEWLRFVETLSEGEEDDIRRTSVRAMAQILESPGGAMYVPAESGGRMVPVASWPMRPADLPMLAALQADSELTRFLETRQWVVDLREYGESPEAYQNIEIPAFLLDMPRLRLIVPLLGREELAGFVLLLNPPPPFELTFEDHDLLKTLGRHVATIVAQHEADRRLAESRQFEAYHRLTAFMMHDLKNSVAQLQLVVRNAERHRHNPEFIDDAMGTVANAVERMTRLIEQLKGTGERAAEAPVDLGLLAGRVVTQCADRNPVPQLEAVEGAIVRADPGRLAGALEHLVRNAQDACSDSGMVTVRVSANGGQAVVSVEDDGAGMSEEFVRERLFRPFDSTKGPKGMGIGAYQVREYVRGLGGDVEVRSSPGSGTRFDVRLPIAATDADAAVTEAVGESRPRIAGAV